MERQGHAATKGRSRWWRVQQSSAAVLNRVAVALMRLPVRIAFRPQVSGVEHLPPHGGFVVASNHLSGFDVLAIAYPLAPRVLRFMAKDELFARRFLGPLIRKLGAFPAHGSGAGAAARLASEGNVVVIFPTGARRRSDRVHRPRGGAAHAALESGVPLVPAALAGTDSWRRLQRWQIALGPAVRLDDLEVTDGVAEATRRLWHAIESLSDDLPTRVAA